MSGWLAAYVFTTSANTCGSTKILHLLSLSLHYRLYSIPWCWWVCMQLLPFVVNDVVSGAPPEDKPAATSIGRGALTCFFVILCHIVWGFVGCSVVSCPVTFPAQWKEVYTCRSQITDIIQTLINCTSLIKAYPCDIPVWEHPLLGQLEHLPCASFQRRNSKVRDRRNSSLALLSMSPKFNKNLRI